MSESPDDSLTYGERLRRKGIHVRSSGWTSATRDQVNEGRTEEGGRYKAVLDQAGHVVTEETTASGSQRKHVTINLR